MEASGGAVGAATDAANALVDAAKNAVAAGANIAQSSGNAVVSAGAGEAATLLNAGSETLEHLAQLFADLSKALVGES